MSSKHGQNSKIPPVSIVIPTYNRIVQLNRLLKSIGGIDYPTEQTEVIIVDNAGSLAKSDLKNIPNLKLLTPPKNLFCGGGRRYGARYAKGKFLFFIDDDNILEKSCISNLVTAIRDDPSCGIVGPLMLDYDDKQRVWCAGGRFDRLGLPRYILNRVDMSTDVLPKEIRTVDFFPNAFMIRASILPKINFPQDILLHNWSEPDLSNRVVSLGYSIKTITNAHEWHDIGYSGPLTRISPISLYDQASSRIYYRRIHRKGIKDWAIFWLAIFPVSTIFYMRAIFSQTIDKKASMIGIYLRGTKDGLIKPINEGGL